MPTMSPHTARAELLLQQRRYDLAEQSLGAALATDPEDGYAHALLGVCYLDTDRLPQAREALGKAVTLLPGEAMPHHCLGLLALREHRHGEARAAADEAVRLEPESPGHHALRAQIEASAQKWADALRWADRGLALDGEDTTCLNLRGLALTHLGRQSDATETLGDALRHSPDDPLAHTSRGYQMLHANQPKDALEHFREALRLEPGFEPAKLGLIEALKAKNPLYRLLLAFFLWMARLSPGVRVGVLVGGYVLFRVAIGWRAAQPGMGMVLTPVIVAYIVFAVLTWIAVPATDLLLRLSRYGRHALPPSRRRASTVFGLLLLLPFVVFAGGIAVLSMLPMESGGELFERTTTAVGVYSVFAALLLLPAAGVLTRVDHFRFSLYAKVLAGLYGIWLLGFGLAFIGHAAEGSVLTVLQFGLIGAIWFLALSGTQPTSR